MKIIAHSASSCIKTSGGLGDIFYAVPALYVLKNVFEEVAFAVEPRLVSFFKKHLDGISIVDETRSKTIEKEYNKVIELGNYPAYMDGFRLSNAIPYVTDQKIKQHAMAHYADAVARFHRDADSNISFPYFKRIPNFENPYYTVHAGAGLLLKAWPSENFARLIRQIEKRFPVLGCKIIVGPGDPNLADFLQEMESVELITGGIDEVGDAMSRALFHIGNDSGITHIADAFNVPTLGIYGPTGPGVWGNFAEHHETVWGKTGMCDLK